MPASPTIASAQPKPEGHFVRFFGKHGLAFLHSGCLKLTPIDQFNDPHEFTFAPAGRLSDEEQKQILRDPGFMVGHNARNITGLSGADYQRWTEQKNVHALWPEALDSLGQSFRKAVSDIVGISCFMDLLPDDLEKAEMVHAWDRYADCHAGLAVEFDAAQLMDVVGRDLFSRVDYDQHGTEPPSLDPRLAASEAALEDALRKRARHKSRVWSYEREWRVIRRLAPTDDLARSCSRIAGEKLLHFMRLWDPVSGKPLRPGGLQRPPITRIILGCRASESLEASVRQLREMSYLRHVAIHRASVAPQSYGFVYPCLRDADAT